jgi:Cu-Zn family superoxide dismutase
VAAIIQVLQRSWQMETEHKETVVADGSLFARANLLTPAGSKIGIADIFETPTGLLIRLSLRDLPAGSHGFHFHEIGRCEAPSFESAGGHVANGRDHGFLSLAGPHPGDLANVVVSVNGRAEDTVRAPGLRLAGLLDEDGAALIVHAQADDYATQPSGGAGARIACGILHRRAIAGV